MTLLLVFAASFGQVFFLGLNSKLLRDDKIFAGFITSWFITLTQYIFVWCVTQAGLSATEFLLSAGLGGSMGITIAQYVYAIIRPEDKT